VNEWRTLRWLDTMNPCAVPSPCLEVGMCVCGIMRAKFPMRRLFVQGRFDCFWPFICVFRSPAITIVSPNTVFCMACVNTCSTSSFVCTPKGK